MTGIGDLKSNVIHSAWGSIGNKVTNLQMPKSATVRIARVPKVIRRAVEGYVKGVFLAIGLQPLWDDWLRGPVEESMRSVVRNGEFAF
jgi:hypothetical protein